MEESNIPHLATVKRTAEIFKDAGQTPAAIRANIFKAEDRINSRGEKIPGNGLASSGALIRRGNKILININKYAEWLSGTQD